MQIFISWSGNRSRYIAEALRIWLPKVIQSVRPWMSDIDIQAGTRWLAEVSDKLSSSTVGIICITPENCEKPWLMFEAGALSKALKETCVCPLLFEMSLNDLKNPLGQFQSNILDKPGLFKVIQAINQSLPQGALPIVDLQESFDLWWPKIAEKLQQIPERPQEAAPAVDIKISQALKPLEALIRRHILQTGEENVASNELIQSPVVMHSDKVQVRYQAIRSVHDALEMLEAKLITSSLYDYGPNDDVSKRVPEVRVFFDQVKADRQNWISNGLGVPLISLVIPPKISFDKELFEIFGELVDGSGSFGIGISEISLTDPTNFSEKLNVLNSRGLRIILNDFGTGYSSLSYLRLYPINFIKIAQEFSAGIIEDVNDKAIVDAIIEIGKSLKFKVIADGVANEEQFSYLKERNISWMQGAYIDLDRSAQEIPDILSRA